jgi:enolase-phosphatase E1
VTVDLAALRTRALVVDIEGTTTPVDFVYEVLFPFARAHAADYLRDNWTSPACRAAVAQLRAEHEGERGDRESGSGAAATDFTEADALAYVNRLMDADRKSTGLKALQGLIWQEGYEQAFLRGQVYPDVPDAFRKWRANGRDIYIYSSGSVLAQRLLFESTDAGDLTPLLSGYFDTHIGPKIVSASYRAISERIRVDPAEMLFVSDVAAELDAARGAGLSTALCVRDDAARQAQPTHTVVCSFEQISA